MKKNGNGTTFPCAKGYDELISKLLWFGKPAKSMFMCPLPWRRIPTSYCELEGDKCTGKHNEHSHACNAISIIILIDCFLFSFSVLALFLQREHRVGLAITLAASILILYPLIVLFNIVHWCNHREDLKRKVDKIEGASAKKVVVSCLRAELEHLRDRAIGAEPNSLKHLLDRLEERILLLDQRSNAPDDEVRGDYRSFSRVRAEPVTRLDRVRRKLELRRTAVTRRLADVEEAFRAFEGEIASIGEMADETDQIEASAKLDPSLAGELEMVKREAFDRITNFVQGMERLAESAVVKDGARFEEEDEPPSYARGRVEIAEEVSYENADPPASSKRRMTL